MPRAATPRDDPRVRIRVLGPDDAAALKACRATGVRKAQDAFLTTAAEVERTPVAQFEAELSDPDMRYVGAFDGARLVGFMRYVRFARQARRHVAELRSVHVVASHRRHGIASRLLERLVSEASAAGIESLVLAVVDGNLPARRLYESAGFVLYGTEPRAIRKGAADLDQLHMRLPLPTSPGPR